MYFVIMLIFFSFYIFLSINNSHMMYDTSYIRITAMLIIITAKVYLYLLYEWSRSS